jgi:hypothetical protein
MNKPKWLRFSRPRGEERVAQTIAEWRAAEGPEERGRHLDSVYAAIRRVILLRYGDGEPREKVLEHAGLFYSCYLEKLERRPSIGRVSRNGGKTWEEREDWSLGNSWSTLQSAWLLLSLGFEREAREIAAKTYDPPGAPYVLRSSPGQFGGVTVGKQALAYAFKDLMAGDPGPAEQVLEVVGRGPDAAEHSLKGSMMRALALGERTKFLQVLEKMLIAHRKFAEKSHRANRTDPETFLCVPAAAMTFLALRQGLVTLDELPADDPLLGVQLFAPALSAPAEDASNDEGPGT